MSNRQRLGILVATVATSFAAIGQVDPRLAQGRELAANLQQELGTRLTAAIATSGPVGAISVCSLEAPGIAERLSAQAGARVGRTSLKVRNPANAPDEAASATLQRFEREWQGSAGAPPEAFSVAGDGSARYMRAIPTQPLCVVCHGTAIAPDVAAALAARYPADSATGFGVGTLRGSFVIDWPARSR
jgi:hypothetical protein